MSSFPPHQSPDRVNLNVALSGCANVPVDMMISDEIDINNISEIRTNYLKCLMKGITRFSFNNILRSTTFKMSKTDSDKLVASVKECLLANENITDHNDILLKKGIIITE